jgi:hypothetical protein
MNVSQTVDARPDLTSRPMIQAEAIPRPRN